MVEKKPVSVNWQSLFIVIPIVDLWAAYRIEKFRIYFVIFWIASATLQNLVIFGMLGDGYWSDEGWILFTAPDVANVQIMMMVTAAIIQIFVIRRWSSDWNSMVDKINPSYVSGDDSPIELLKKRYAMGDISKEEFEKMKEDLE